MAAGEVQFEDSQAAADGSKCEDTSEDLVFATRPRSDRADTVYCRSWNPAREKLESALLQLYGRDPSLCSAFVFPSGMAAISAVMQTAVTGSCDTPMLVYGDEVYVDVHRVVKYLGEMLAPRLRTIAVDIRDRAMLLEVFREHGAYIRLFHFEACTNPSGQSIDFGLLPELKRLAPEAVFVCDNTWLSAALFNPFYHHCDLVVESMTKYVSAGRCIGGAAIGPDGLMAPVLSYIRNFGVFVGADHCQIFLEGISTLCERVLAASEAAQQVARHLEAHPAVSRVLYPLLPSHPSYEVAERLLRSGGPGCVWFHVNGCAKKDLMKALKTIDTIEFKTSFGGKTARFDPWPAAMASNAFDFRDGKKPSPETGVAGVWVRLALGYAQDVKVVLACVDALLARFCSEGRC